MLKEDREKGQCRFVGCNHYDSEYIVKVELNRLGAREEALSCREHVGQVALALADVVRDYIRRGMLLAEIDDPAAAETLLEVLRRERESKLEALRERERERKADSPTVGA